MKKRILSILLTLCMVLMLCPMTAFAEGNYMITQNFKYGTRTYDGTDPQTSPYQFVIPAGGSFSLGTIEDCAPYERLEGERLRDGLSALWNGRKSEQRPDL